MNRHTLNIIKLLQIVTFFIGIFSSQALASPLSEFYINQALERYFILPQDAETLSLAGSTELTCKSSNCLYLNPAGLGQLSHSEFSTTLGYSQIDGEYFPTEEGLKQSEYHGNGILALRLGSTENGRPKFGTIALAFSRYDGHTDDIIHTTPDGHRRSLAYGYSPFDNLSLGYSFTFYDDQLRSAFADLHSTSRLLHIWGIQVRPFDDWEIGTSFKLGIGQSDTEDFRFGSDGLSHLRQYSSALGIKKTIDPLIISFSFDYTRVQSRGDLDRVAIPVVIGGTEQGNIYNIRFGTSYNLNDNFLIRGGIRWQNVESYNFERSDLEGLSGDVRGLGWTTGVGYLFGGKNNSKARVALDYGLEYLDIGHGAWQHLITLRLPFTI